MEGDQPFPPRLRRVCIHATERIQYGEVEVSGPETVRLLNRLGADVGDGVEKYPWVRLLVEVMCLPIKLDSLSSHYWRLLAKLVLATDLSWIPGSRRMEVMRSLKKAEDWEKLEVWMAVVWQSLSNSEPTPEIERVTLELLLQRPSSALPRFKELYERGTLYPWDKTKLRHMYNQVLRTDQSPSESLPSQSSLAQPLIPLPLAGDDTF